MLGKKERTWDLEGNIEPSPKCKCPTSGFSLAWENKATVVCSWCVPITGISVTTAGSTVYWYKGPMLGEPFPVAGSVLPPGSNLWYATIPSQPSVPSPDSCLTYQHRAVLGSTQNMRTSLRNSDWTLTLSYVGHVVLSNLLKLSGHQRVGVFLFSKEVR
jgi:hypothetical protein